MYYGFKGVHGYIKLDTKLAWEMIRQIIEGGHETLMMRSFKLSL